jgi:Flp pilus assembly protein TadG
VEFALAIPFILMIFLGLVDLSRYMFYEQSVSHIVRSALRVAVTGKVDENPNYDPDDSTSNEFLTRRQTIIYAAQENNPINVKIDAGSGSAGADDTLIIFPADGGGAGEDVTLSLEYDFKFLTPFFNLIADAVSPTKDFTIKHSTTYRNENFDE